MSLKQRVIITRLKAKEVIKLIDKIFQILMKILVTFYWIIFLIPLSLISLVLWDSVIKNYFKFLVDTWRDNDTYENI
jgi:hypothetical protein